MGLPSEVRIESALHDEVVRIWPGHRYWPNEIKGRIVADTLGLGVLDSAVWAAHRSLPSFLSLLR